MCPESYPGIQTENGERISFINAIAEEKKYVESPQHVRKVTSPCKNLNKKEIGCCNRENVNDAGSERGNNSAKIQKKSRNKQ